MEERRKGGLTVPKRVRGAPKTHQERNRSKDRSADDFKARCQLREEKLSPRFYRHSHWSSGGSLSETPGGRGVNDARYLSSIWREGEGVEATDRNLVEHLGQGGFRSVNEKKIFFKKNERNRIKDINSYGLFHGHQ
ncbi:hypothetical protein TNCV_5012751 [Trichonephila clavipes]|nr:hypothetical protein TNCV_5012751 [Trichonephila clavipes]